MVLRKSNCYAIALRMVWDAFESVLIDDRLEYVEEHLVPFPVDTERADVRYASLAASDVNMIQSAHRLVSLYYAALEVFHRRTVLAGHNGPPQCTEGTCGEIFMVVREALRVYHEMVQMRNEPRTPAWSIQHRDVIRRCAEWEVFEYRDAVRELLQRLSKGSQDKFRALVERRVQVVLALAGPLGIDVVRTHLV